jgi:2-iminobutanoate/2-iminopropanoate deaminase
MENNRMSALEFISTPNAPAAVGPYSQAVAAGATVYVSGQLGLEPGTMAFPADFEGQARQSLRNVAASIEASGCSITDIASVDVFLVDMAQFKAFNAIYSEFMGDHKPARAAVQVAALPLGGLVEVKCIAIRK